MRRWLQPRREELRANGEIGPSGNRTYPIIPAATDINLTGLARLETGANLIVEYGQSKANGSEGWPVKTRTPYDNNSTLGGSYFSRADDSWKPYGNSNAYEPLVARIPKKKSGCYSDEEVAAFARSSKMRGEPPGVAAANFLKALANRRAGLTSDPTRQIVYGNAAQGGRELSELIRGHTVGNTEWYGRVSSLMRASRAQAEEEGLGHQLLAILFAQGETESLNASVATKTRGEYKALLKRMHADLLEDAAALAGNQRPPGFFFWQVGGGFTRDEDGAGQPDMYVQMAQLEYALENRNSAFLIGRIILTRTSKASTWTQTDTAGRVSSPPW